MNNINNNPTEGVTNQTSVNVTEGFNPITIQTNIVLDMVKEHFEWEIEKKEDFVKFLKKDEEKDLEYLKYEETDLFELKYLNDLVINLQQQLGGQ
jgi:hypothetical protein